MSTPWAGRVGAFDDNLWIRQNTRETKGKREKSPPNLFINRLSECASTEANYFNIQMTGHKSGSRVRWLHENPCEMKRGGWYQGTSTASPTIQVKANESSGSIFVPYCAHINKVISSKFPKNAFGHRTDLVSSQSKRTEFRTFFFLCRQTLKRGYIVPMLWPGKVLWSI